MQERLPNDIARLALVIVLAVTAAGCVRELPSDGRGLPYRVIKTASEQSVMDIDIADFDGDGIDEIADIRRSSGHPYYYLSIRRMHNGDLVPMVQRPEMTHFRRGGMADVDGDGLPEYFLSQRVGERALLTPFTVRITGETAQIDSLRSARPIVVPLTDYVENTSSWDGRLFVSETHDLDDDGFRETAFFVCSVGYAGSPRGVGRADLRTGRIAWLRRFAGNPVSKGRTLDLDADGEVETVLGLGAPGNGVTWQGRSDTTSYLAAVDLDGDLLWEVRTGGQSARTETRCLDMDDDGDMDLVTWSHYGAADRPDSLGVSLRDPADGSVVASWLSDAMVNDVATASLPDGAAVFAVTDDGWIRRLRFRSGDLIVDRAVRMPAQNVKPSAPTPAESGDRNEKLPGADDDRAEGTDRAPDAPPERAARAHPSVVSVSWLTLDPVRSPVVCVGASDGVVAVLDADLRPLALERTDRTIVRRGIFSHTGEGGVRQTVVRTSDGYFAVALTSVPPSVWTIALVGLAGLAGAGVCVPKVRRVSASMLRRWLTPAPERERQIEGILNELAVAGHGELTATGTVRRLRELLVMMHSGDGPAPASFVERYEQAVDDLTRVGLPRVRAIFKQAERAGVAPGVVERLRRAVAEFQRTTSRLPAEPPGEAASAELVRGLDDLLETTNPPLRALRRECRLELSSSIMQELRRAARVNAEGYIAAGAEIRMPTATPLEDVRVFGKSMEVSFILENLLANALRAVGGADTRRVEIDLAREDDEIVLRISDTGCGIPAALQERLFERGASSKEDGGGTGLAASREILERRGGCIRVVESSPEGTTFEVRFEVC